MSNPVTTLLASGKKAPEIKELGHTAANLILAGDSVQNVIQAGYTLSNMQSAGCNIAQLVAANAIPRYLCDTNGNVVVMNARITFNSVTGVISAVVNRDTNADILLSNTLGNQADNTVNNNNLMSYGGVHLNLAGTPFSNIMASNVFNLWRNTTSNVAQISYLSTQTFPSLTVKAPLVVEPAVLCWYDLSDASTRLTSSGTSVTTNGNPIYKILDKSGNGYHMFNVGGTANANTLNTNGLAGSKTVVQTSGTSAQCGFRTTGTSPPFHLGLTFFAVYRPLGGGAASERSLISKSGGPGNNAPMPIDVYTTDRITGSNAQSYAEHVNPLMSHNVSTASANAFCVNFNWGGSNKAYSEYINGTSAGTRTYSILAYTDNTSIPFYLCNRADGYTHNYAHIAEVLCYNGPISSTLRQKIEGYLMWKWGLSSSIPTGHPYKSAAPAGFSPLTG